jgi:hypothetical protein
MADEISSFSPRSIDTQMGPIDWTRPRLPRQPLPWPVGGASVSPQPGFWQNLQNFAAPAARVAGEMTGVPAAARAGQAFAEGNAMQGAGQALMALPGRLTALPGMILSEAGAAEPDPRMKAISDLNREIAQREKKLGSFPRINFPSRAARADAVRIEESGIAAARARIKTLEGEMDQERKDAAARTQAEQSAARWAQTPFARKHPGIPETMAGVGAAVGSLIPFARARGTVGAFNTRIADLDQRWGDAVARARNNRLAPQARTQAANEARALEAEFRQVIAEGAHNSRLGAAGIGAAATDLGLALPTGIDYLASRADPQGELGQHTMHSLDPTNPELYGRLGLGMIGGGALGELANELGSFGAQRPTGHHAATATLNKRYTRRSR